MQREKEAREQRKGIGQRERADSEGSLEHKRKRSEGKAGREEGNKEGVAGDPFKKSRMTGRSPRGKGQEGKDHEELKDMIASLSKEVKEGRKEMEAMRTRLEGWKEDLRIEREQWKEEIRALRKEMGEKEVKWESEKEAMNTKMEGMEQRMEQQERRERRSNVVIRGLGGGETGTCLKEKVATWIKTEMGVEVVIREAHRTGRERDCIIAKMESVEDKIRTMKEKGKLKGQKIYVDDDLTIEERGVQKQIRDKAREQKATGKEVRVRYRKLLINGKTFKWDEKRRELIEETFLQ